uniref:Carboxylic ester hydrolase (EC) n=1 Tax=Ganoderma boninense TaxID=34458 RepID=A0A5K1JVC2_9APHY|nr:Carboxylic ester hydrolase (EC [Ganoderma boninense]
MDHSSAAEQRATAVAKLKRAASLPRMKDGRRPPMHVEAVSEGERSQGEERDATDAQEEIERGRNGREGKSSEEEVSANEVSKGKDTGTGARSEVEATTDAEAVGESLEPRELRNEEGEGPPRGSRSRWRDGEESSKTTLKVSDEVKRIEGLEGQGDGQALPSLQFCQPYQRVFSRRELHLWSW